jgi:hypothetical protein
VRVLRSNTSHGQPVHFHAAISAPAISAMLDADTGSRTLPVPIAVMATGQLSVDVDGCATGVGGSWHTAPLAIVRFGMAVVHAFATPATPPDPRCPCA